MMHYLQETKTMNYKNDLGENKNKLKKKSKTTNNNHGLITILHTDSFVGIAVLLSALITAAIILSNSYYIDIAGLPENEGFKYLATIKTSFFFFLVLVNIIIASIALKNQKRRIYTILGLSINLIIALFTLLGFYYIIVFTFLE
jgi:hypothetical protein